MLPIYICDDNLQHLQNIKQQIQLFFSIKYPEFSVQLHTYSTPEKLLEALNTNTVKPNIYFLDYQLNAAMNGLNLARAIREQDAVGPIIFITDYEECWTSSYKYHVSAITYINKSSKDLQAEISKALDEAIKFYKMYLAQNAKPPSNICSIKSGRSIHQIHEQDIVYFEKSDKLHIVDVYTKNLVIHPRDTVAGILNKLSMPLFFQCNRATVINIHHIKNLNPKTCTVQVRDKTFTLSKAKMKELRRLVKW